MQEKVVPAQRAEERVKGKNSRNVPSKAGGNTDKGKALTHNARDSLINLLLEVQEGNGYLPEEVLKDIAERMSVPLSQVYGIATFYSQFRLRPSGRNVIKVCHGTACYVGGAQSITDSLSDELGIEEGATTSNRAFTLESVACLGCCGLAPVMMIGERTHGCLSADKARQVVKEIKRYEKAAKDLAAGKP